MILYQYILFTIVGYFLGLYYGFYKFNSFHGPDSNVIKKLVYYNPNKDDFYKLKPVILKEESLVKEKIYNYIYGS